MRKRLYLNAGVALLLVVTAVASGTVIASENLLRNPEFLSPNDAGIPMEWATWIPAGATAEFETLVEGDVHIVRIFSEEGYGRGTVRQLNVPVEANRKYRASVQFKSDLWPPPENADPMHVVLRIQWFPGELPGVSNIKVDYPDVLSDLASVYYAVRDGVIYAYGPDDQEEWDTLSIDVVAPNGAKYALFELFIWEAKGEAQFKSPSFAAVD